MGDARRLWVISYDIVADSRRVKVQKALETHGDRRQKSVCECRLSEAELTRLWQRLSEVIDPRQDSILAWPLTRAGHADSRSLGVAAVADFDEPGHHIV